MDRAKLGDLLIEQGHVDPETRDALLERQRTEHRRMGELLLEVANVEDAILLELLARQHGVPAVDLAAHPPSDEVMAHLPEQLVRRWEVVPLEVREKTLVVGMVDPRSRIAVEEIRRASGFTDIQRRVITSAAFATFAKDRFGEDSELSRAVAEGTHSEVTVHRHQPPNEAEPPPEAADDQPVVALVDYVLSHAIELGASDVHIEPFETSSRVRLRVDGALTTLMTLPRRLHAPIVLRLRALAGAPTGVPRGVVEVAMGERDCRFQLSVLPSLHGSKAMLRHLDFDLRDLADLDLQADVRSRLEQALQVAQGLVLVVGPRRSGRTTTAMAVARVVNTASRQLAVVTRTCDAAPPGAIVVPVPAGSTDMAGLVDDTLAQDPDVLVIDGADDSKTMQAAARAAVEGHLVILTLGGSRAVGAIQDLVASGVPAYQVAASLRCCLAQRLCRRVDAESAVDYTPEARELKEFGVPSEAAQKAHFKRPEAAASNNGTGYRGRVAVQEVLFPSPPLRAGVRDGLGPEALLELARKDGFHTLWEDAILKVLRGDTTFEEVRAVLVPPA